MTERAETSVRMSSWQRWTMVAVILGSAIVFLDTSVVNLALPAIAEELPLGNLAPLEAQSYVRDGYFLTLSALLILGGGLTDYFGRRRMFTIGLLGFLVTSVLCGFAPNVHTLIAFRLLQGATGALVVPGSLAIITASFEGEQQGKAFAKLARTAGIQHLLYQSVGSAHRNTGIPHFDNKWRVEQTIRELGFPSWTVLRPVFFMDNLLSPWFKPSIQQGMLALGIRPDTRLQMIAVRDIGKYGLRAFERQEAVNGRAIDIAGDELTGPEAAAILSEVIGRRITFESVPLAQVRASSEEFAIMYEWFDAVGYDADIEGTARELDVSPTRFSEWAAEQRWE